MQLELGVFDQAGEFARMLLPPELGDIHHRAHRRGVKLWVATPECPPEHYEAQLLRRSYVDGLDGTAVEVGFHCERRAEPENQNVLQTLVAEEHRWRQIVGREAEAATFFGREGWTRISETWLDPDLEDDDLGFELGSRLADYVLALEDLVAPLRER